MVYAWIVFVVGIFAFVTRVLFPELARFLRYLRKQSRNRREVDVRMEDEDDQDLFKIDHELLRIFALSTQGFLHNLLFS